MSVLPLTAADEVQIFTTVPFSERREKGEQRPSRGRETERAAALPASSTAAILCFSQYCLTWNFRAAVFRI